MEGNIVSVAANKLYNDLKYNGETVLTYTIEYPEFKSQFYRAQLAALNRFYRDKARAYQKYCETELFRSAVKEYKNSVKNNYPVRAFQAFMTYQATYLAACIISLYFDTYEYTGGAHGNTVREAQTWNLSTRRRIRLHELIKCAADYKTYILEMVAAQIQKEPEIYFDDYKKLAEEKFDKNNFYCTPEAVVVFYQQYDIAPYSSGIREFMLPYSECVLDPIKLCRAI